jgi:hypothetical protein
MTTENAPDATSPVKPSVRVVDQPDAPPPRLGPETIDDFLVWAASVPVGEVDAVRRAIASAAASQRDELVDVLHRELWRLPVTDVSRHLVLLSTVGELRDPRSAARLAELVWFEPLVDERPGTTPGCTFEVDPTQMIQARAVEMLSYLATQEADRLTLRVALEHSSPAVRAAAIDAHLYNHGDSVEEADRLRSLVRSEDVVLVGVPRFTRDADPEELARSVREFYDRHPSERADDPRHGEEPEPRHPDTGEPPEGSA